MSEPIIFVIKPGAMKDHQKAKLTKAGVIVVEAENPDDVKAMRVSRVVPTDTLPSDDLLLAFATAMINSGSDNMKKALAGEIAEVIRARTERKEASNV